MSKWVIFHIYGKGVAYEVEFADGIGATVALITLEPEAIQAVDRGDLLHTRRQEPAACKAMASPQP